MEIRTSCRGAEARKRRASGGEKMTAGREKEREDGRKEAPRTRIVSVLDVCRVNSAQCWIGQRVFFCFNITMYRGECECITLRLLVYACKLINRY